MARMSESPTCRTILVVADVEVLSLEVLHQGEHELLVFVRQPPR
jgi:hypothetical protein